MLKEECPSLGKAILFLYLLHSNNLKHHKHTFCCICNVYYIGDTKNLGTMWNEGQKNDVVFNYLLIV